MTISAETNTTRSIEPLGSSLRHRRLVIAGYVAFDPIALARPSMRPKEIALLTALLRRARHVVEYGAGGSTTLGLKLGLTRLVSVESDLAWISRIFADEAASRAHEDGRLVLLHADIGQIGLFGGPHETSDRSKWPDYPRMPWRAVVATDVDLVLIDGRFRVACILETLLRADGRTTIAIHDFWNRPAYHGVLPFLEVVDRCQTLGVFAIKQGIDRARVQALLDEAIYWPA